MICLQYSFSLQVTFGVLSFQDMVEVNEHQYNACVDIISASWSYRVDSTTADIILWESQMSCFSIFCKKRRSRRLPSSHHNEGRALIRRAHSEISLFTYCDILSSTLFCSLLWFISACVDVPGGPNIKRYTYRELVRATENFSPSNKIGEGGFGSVYKVICITFNREATEVVANVDVFDIQQFNGAGTAQEWNNYCCQGSFVRVKTRSKGVSEWTCGNFWHLTW